MKLGTALGDSFKTYFKKPLLFSGVYVAAMALLLVFNLVLIPSGILLSVPLALTTGNFAALLGVAGLVMLLYIAVSIVVGALNLGGLIKASADTIAGHKTSVMTCIKYASERIKDYIILGLRVFWYTLWWVMILLIILAPFLGGLLGGGTANAQSEMPTEFAEMFEGLEGMEDVDVAGLMGGFDTTSMSYNYPVNFNVNPILGFVYFVLLIFIIYRTLRAFFAFYILFDDPKVSTKEALEKSIKLTKGNLWRLIGYAIVFGLIIGIASSVISGVIFTSISRSIAGSGLKSIEIFSSSQMVLNFILAAVIGPLSVVYYYIVYKGWSKEKHA